jgi:hypothetical protein
LVQAGAWISLIDERETVQLGSRENSAA